MLLHYIIQKKNNRMRAKLKIKKKMSIHLYIYIYYYANNFNLKKKFLQYVLYKYAHDWNQIVN